MIKTIGNGTAYLGDCLEVMKNIPDGSIDCIITDLPYGITDCKWDTIIPFSIMWERLNKLIKLKKEVRKNFKDLFELYKK